jgi:SRSO17 transposase
MEASMASLSSEDDSKVLFAAYVDALGGALGHADRAGPTRRYCGGLLLPGEGLSMN